MTEWESKTISYSMPTDPIELMIVNAFSKLDKTSEEYETILEQLLNTVCQVEFYTIFTKRTMEYLEESLLSNISMLTIILELNMYVTSELERNKELLNDLHNFIHGLYKSVDVKNYSDTILSGSETFLTQIYNDDDKLVPKVVNTWYKVVILIYVYFNSISQFLLIHDRG